MLYSKLKVTTHHEGNNCTAVEVFHPDYEESFGVACLYKQIATSLNTFLSSPVSFTFQKLHDKKLIIIGHFNTQSSEPTINSFFKEHGFKNIIHEPTTNGGTNIDLCFTNIRDYTCGVHETYFSYHKGIWIQFSNSQENTIFNVQ